MQIACAVALWGVSMMCWQGCRPPAATQPKAVMKEMAFDLMDAWVEGDSLHAVVRYGGGCKAHFFRLQKDGPMLKSLPPHPMGSKIGPRAIESPFKITFDF